MNVRVVDTSSDGENDTSLCENEGSGAREDVQFSQKAQVESSARFGAADGAGIL